MEVQFLRYECMSTIENSRGEEYALGGRLTDARLLQTWGLAVTGGWIVSQLIVLTGTTDAGTQLGLTAFWLIGSLVPITASFLWMRSRTFTGLFPIWTVLGVTGLLASFAVIVELLPIAPVLVLGGLWFAGPAVGFGVTAAYMNDWSSRLYAGAAVANLVGAAVIVAVPGFGAFYAIVAAVIQGLPMLYHGSRLG